MSTGLLKTGPKEAQLGRLIASGSSRPAMCVANFNTCWKYAHAPCAGASHPTACPPHRPDGNLATCVALRTLRSANQIAYHVLRDTTNRNHAPHQQHPRAPQMQTCSRSCVMQAVKIIYVVKLWPCASMSRQTPFNLAIITHTPITS